MTATKDHRLAELPIAVRLIGAFEQIRVRRRARTTHTRDSRNAPLTRAALGSGRTA
jgi:hypothetical protein